MNANYIDIIRVLFCSEKQTGPGYGPNCQKDDLSVEDFEIEKGIFLERLDYYHKNRTSVEENTKEKNRSSLWNEIARNIIPSKDFGSVCKGRAFATHVKDLTQAQYGETKAMKHQNQSLSVAVQQLAKEQNMTIQECGLYIDDDHKFLATSPSGIVTDADSDAIVHVLCPLAITNKDPNDTAVLGKIFYFQSQCFP